MKTEAARNNKQQKKQLFFYFHDDFIMIFAGEFRKILGMLRFSWWLEWNEEFGVDFEFGPLKLVATLRNLD